jgi:hypothetical protein
LLDWVRRLRLEVETGRCPFPEAEVVVMACLWREVVVPEAVEEDEEDKESRGGRAWTFFFVFAGAGSEGRLARNAEWQSKADIQTE